VALVDARSNSSVTTVLRLEGGETIAAVAGETGVRRKLLYQWRDAYRAMGTAGFNRKRGPKVMKGGLPPPQVAEMSCYSAG
jgi:transposase-like protein